MKKPKQTKVFLSMEEETLSLEETHNPVWNPHPNALERPSWRNNKESHSLLLNERSSAKELD